MEAYIRAATPSLTCYLFTDTPIHTVFASLITVLVSLVDIKYQGKTLTPFETHPVTIMVLVLSLLVYCCLAYAAKQAFVSTEACSRFMALSGSLSLVTLASLLLPEPLCIALHAFYGLVLVAGAYSYGTFHKLYHWIRLASLLLPEPLCIALHAFYGLVLVAGAYSYSTFHKLYHWIRRIVEEKLVDGFRVHNRLHLPRSLQDVN